MSFGSGTWASRSQKRDGVEARGVRQGRVDGVAARQGGGVGVWVDALDLHAEVAHGVKENPGAAADLDAVRQPNLRRMAARASATARRRAA